MRVYSDNAYAAMLLTMALSPGKEEYARPYSVQEFRQLEETVRASELKSMRSTIEAAIAEALPEAKAALAEARALVPLEACRAWAEPLGPPDPGLAALGPLPSGALPLPESPPVSFA